MLRLHTRRYLSGEPNIHGSRSTTNSENNKHDLQRQLDLIVAPNSHESRETRSKTMDGLGLRLTSCTNQGEAMNTSENQEKTRRIRTDTGDRTTWSTGDQQTLMNLLNQDLYQDLYQWDPTKAGNGISIHGPCSLGPRTTLVIHTEATETAPRS